MFLKNLIKFGLPLSFLHCTVYIQDIWREGDERLLIEQRRTWQSFTDRFLQPFGWSLNELRFGSNYNYLDVKAQWNSNVLCLFKSIDQGKLSNTVSKLSQQYLAKSQSDKPKQANETST